MKKILTFFTLLFLVFAFSACKNDKVTLAKPANIQMAENGLISWDKVEHATSYTITFNDQTYDISTPFYLINDLTKDFTFSVVAKSDGLDDSEVSELFVYQAPKIEVPQPKPLDVVIGIKGTSEVKSGKSIKLEANVTGGKTNEVKWEVVQGNDYITVEQDGTVTANEKALNEKDVICEVKVTSLENPKCFTSKFITVLSKPKLTQEMIDEIAKENFLQFEGYLNISLYPVGSKKLYQTFNTVIKTALDGDYWYAEYENQSAMVKQSIYYKNNGGYACQVGVNFMNEEEYSYALKDNGDRYTWEEYGLYNNFNGLTINDFTFNEDTWRYEYNNADSRLDEKMIASMNPYDFIANGFSLLIEDDEILGVYAKSLTDYTIVEQYEAIQEIFIVINKGEDNVEVKKVPRYTFDEEVHGPLKEALDKLKSAENYTLKYLNTQASVMTSSITEQYFVEYITQNDCYFEPFDIIHGANTTYKPSNSGTYGYHKITDSLYNSYYQEFNDQNEVVGYKAARAFEGDFNSAKPSLQFVPEIFTSYYIDEEEKTTTYYVDEIMCGVASTFFYGVGNDINLYGIYATRGYTSQTESFTPFIVVNNETNTIESVCFYYYLGYLYGVIEISYEDINETQLPEGVTIDFETRNVPSSWKDLTIEVTNQSDGETTVNAFEYLTKFFGIEKTPEKENEFLENMPFFTEVLGDTYGFGMTQFHIDSKNINHPSITLYYDVPLDINYSIDSSLKKVDEYLLSIGFTKNKHGEYNKGDIWVQPVDKDLDFLIYVWKDR